MEFPHRSPPNFILTLDRIVIEIINEIIIMMLIKGYSVINLTFNLNKGGLL
jgi:hypothetical protein